MALCERCKTDILLANEFDRDPRIDRGQVAVIAGGEYRRLAPSEWAIFGMLYSRKPRLVPAVEMADALNIAQNIRENVRKLRIKLNGTGFEIVTHFGFGYALRAAPPAPAGRLANLQRALCGGERS